MSSDHPEVLILHFGCRRIATTRNAQIQFIENAARRLFQIEESSSIVLTAKFSDQEDELSEIDPLLWPRIYKTLTAVWVTTQGSSPSGYAIYVVTLTGISYTIQVSSSDTVDNLKARIQEKGGMPPDTQRLIFENKELIDGDVTMRERNIRRESMVHVVPRLKGRKPVIYLYPRTPCDVSVALSRQELGVFCIVSHRAYQIGWPFRGSGRPMGRPRTA